MDNCDNGDGPHVLIVGGGLAGLSAAAALHAAGVRTTLLEADARLGGRVRSVRLPVPCPPSAPKADLGATWFHGTVGNAAFDLAVTSGILPPFSSSESESGTKGSQAEEYGGFYDGDMAYFADLLKGPCAVVGPGAKVRNCVPHEAARAAARAFDRVVVFQPSQPTRLADMVRLESEGCRDSDACAAWAAGLAARAGYEAVLNGGPEELVCAQRMHDYERLEGPDKDAGPGGMTCVVNALASQVPAECVHISTEIVSVRWGMSSTHSIRMVARDGRVWTGDAVIWTASLNVTAEAARNDVFEPPLPPSKMHALRCRGMDAVEKVFAVLHEPLRGEEARDRGVLWIGDEDRVMDTDEAAWEHGVHWLEWSAEKQAVEFWLVGESAKLFSELADEKRVIETEVMLQRLLPSADRLAPTKTSRVRVAAVCSGRWWADRFVRGAYSFGRFVDAGEVDDEFDPKDAVLRLSEPVPSVTKPVLCFAGEATHERFYSTMHGAIESGRREALRLIDAHKRRLP